MRVCHSDEAGANETSVELESTFPGSFVGGSAFKTSNLEKPIETTSWFALVLVVLECQSER